ncbi:conserved protein, unknown function [Hepatocystis sp. ex Piliocolobus tephrosceles]|nr:conserved protein, unknown function [Hepatocystis sp. ex Piliocolobus tephrosceles]
MDEFIHEDLELKHRAWELFFSNKKATKFKFEKRKPNKFIIKWIKQADKDNLFERWTKTTIPNENYNSEEDKDEKDSSTDEKRTKKPTYQQDNVRRSYRLNLRQILENNNNKINYVDPSSDISSDEGDSNP